MQTVSFCFFCESLQLDKFEAANFKYANNFFKFQPESTQISHICYNSFFLILAKNTQMRYFWSQIQPFLLFHEILQLDQFEDADFKFDNSFFKFYPKNSPYKVFWVPNLSIFCFFWRNFAIRQNRGCWFQISRWFFKILAQKYSNKTFLVPNQEFSLFHEISQLYQFEGAYFKYDKNMLKFDPKNTQILHFWSQFKRCLFFAPSVGIR